MPPNGPSHAPTAPPPTAPGAAAESATLMVDANLGVALTVELPIGFVAAIQELARRYDATPSDVVRTAMALYGSYLKARSEGSLVGSAKSDDGLDVIFDFDLG
jgi:hypothetical protein